MAAYPIINRGIQLNVTPINLPSANPLTDVASCEISYKKPSGNTGTISATVISNTFVQGYIPAASNDEDGNWTFHVTLTYNDASILTLEAKRFSVVPEFFIA